ncbi:tRNA threonylcarbamoyladenosine dehydratase [Breznakiella homolactica]|uniref:tRNA threonylcarbamoyladenosine dehydratase n=1 Tax=Breznakiella homolactica TaxID=2798577 RepID=A0A7T7XRI1_9SPIR|nr:tRNA threonylcarbamoyladenosine dehydratase [Breznakiella homolactica]QQO11068.1 tRNA threonylcarbamoyladenosine dehydratase [Breznakiella homolactica]
MDESFIRTESILGREAMERLRNAAVAVFGLGGVGSAAAEALARSGIGSFILVDSDTVQRSNINRQIIALHSNLGIPKTAAMKNRILDINPEASVETHELFFTAETGEELLSRGISYIVDAIDTVSSKIELILRARDLGIPIISSMGTGNKLDPSRLEIADIHETSECPLARVMRRELRNRGIEKLTVVYSREPPVKPDPLTAAAFGDQKRPGKTTPGSTAFVPPAAGLIMASRVVRDLTAR